MKFFLPPVKLCHLHIRGFARTATIFADGELMMMMMIFIQVMDYTFNYIIVLSTECKKRTYGKECS